MTLEKNLKIDDKARKALKRALKNCKIFKEKGNLSFSNFFNELLVKFYFEYYGIVIDAKDFNERSEWQEKRGRIRAG